MIKLSVRHHSKQHIKSFPVSTSQGTTSSLLPASTSKVTTLSRLSASTSQDTTSSEPPVCTAKIRNRYNQVPHLAQDTNGKVTNSQLDTTNESKEASPFPAFDHKAHINRRPQRHSKHKTEKRKRWTKEVPPWNGQ